LRRNVRRTPIWGLGCAGGAAGLAHAFHHALGHPEQRTLLVATELCGLTFDGSDMSKSNLVASALFGEGAAAALVVGDKISATGPAIVDSRSCFYPDSLDVMGWNVTNTGLQVVFARRIPDIVTARASDDLGAFLAVHELSFDDIDTLLFHPGGTRVIEAYEQALGLEPERLDLCRGVLRDYGNMSSVTVLFVLERCLQEQRLPAGGFGLVSAMGPGFCSESLLLRG
jgi:alkylresorcinol/alkylpyrone synthase